jgi:hypothetical protein
MAHSVTRYVPGPRNVIAYAEVNPPYTRRPDSSDIFPFLDKRQARRGA